MGGDEHPGPRGGPKAAHDAAPRCRLRGLGMDIHVVCPLTCPRDVTMHRLHSPVHLRGMATPHGICTTPKVALVVNVPTYARSSHSGEGTAGASLDQDEALEDDFQTQHMPVCHVMRREDNGHQSSAEGMLEHSGGSPGQWTGYQIDIGEEEETLETVDPTWRATHWLQLVVQGISDDEVPWYDLITLLMVGTKGVALSLAKCLLAVWWWSIRVQGWDICPPTLMVLNIGQFMMLGEVQGMVGNSLWFEAYSCTLQRVREAACS